MYVSVSLAALTLIVIIAVNLRYVSKKKLFRNAARGIMSAIIIAGQIVMFAILIRLYWINYRKPAPELHISSKMSAGTFWVKDNSPIYFIDGDMLRSIRINGKDSKVIVAADNPVKEYHFSPDGRFIAVLTQNDLYLYNVLTEDSRKIETLVSGNESAQINQEEALRGSISGIQWSPDSRHFVYEIARWSKFSNQDNVYIYSIHDETKKSVNSPTRRISSLYWGQDGKNLYYLRHEAQDTSINPLSYEAWVFKIPLTTLVPEMVTQIPQDKAQAPIENLRLRGINLFVDGPKLSFGGTPRDDFRVSSSGATVGIDEEDYLYFISHKWFRKRLFKIPREARITQLPRHQYQGGELVVDHIRWIPGGKYIIMEHIYWGVLILEPSTGRLGLLIQAKGRDFGWYEESEV